LAIGFSVAQNSPLARSGMADPSAVDSAPAL